MCSTPIHTLKAQHLSSFSIYTIWKCNKSYVIQKSAWKLQYQLLWEWEETFAKWSLSVQQPSPSSRYHWSWNFHTLYMKETNVEWRITHRWLHWFGDICCFRPIHSTRWSTARCLHRPSRCAPENPWAWKLGTGQTSCRRWGMLAGSRDQPWTSTSNQFASTLKTSFSTRAHSLETHVSHLHKVLTSMINRKTI